MPTGLAAERLDRREVEQVLERAGERGAVDRAREQHRVGRRRSRRRRARCRRRSGRAGARRRRRRGARPGSARWPRRRAARAAQSAAKRTAASRRPGGVTAPTTARRRVIALSAAARSRSRRADLGADQRDQLAAVLDRVVERIEAADQQRGDAEVVVVEQRLGHLLRRADQRGGVARRRRPPPRSASRAACRAPRPAGRSPPGAGRPPPRAAAACALALLGLDAAPGSSRALAQACASVGAMIGRSETLNRGARGSRPTPAAAARTVRDAVADRGERLAPEHVDVAVPGADPVRGLGGAAEVERHVRLLHRLDVRVGLRSPGRTPRRGRRAAPRSTSGASARGTRRCGGSACRGPAKSPSRAWSASLPPVMMCSARRGRPRAGRAWPPCARPAWARRSRGGARSGSRAARCGRRRSPRPGSRPRRWTCSRPAPCRSRRASWACEKSRTQPRSISPPITCTAAPSAPSGLTPIMPMNSMAITPS